MATQEPPSVVQRALAAQPFKATTTRRDLTTSIRAFRAAWAALDQAQVLSASCRRLGERAAEVLLVVRAALLEVDEAEKAATAGKVVVERSYEFRREPSDDGRGQAVQSGTSIFRIQSAMLDLQMLATDFLALSTTSRLTLLVDGLSAQQAKLQTLSASLSSCISTYSLPSPSTSLWADEDALDLCADHAALPRLFQLSITLRGPTYDAFLASQPPALAQETPARRRSAFIEWCLERNPLLRAKEGSPSPSAIRRGKPKVSWPPAEGGAIGLGIAPRTPEASPLARRVVSQPLPASSSSSAPFSTASPPPSPTRAARSEGLASSANGVSAAQVASSPSLEPISPLPTLVACDEDPALPPPPASASVASPPAAPSTVASSAPLEPAAPASPPLLHVAAVLPAKPTSPLPADDSELAMARHDSSASSAAMTATSSAGSRLFEPELEAPPEAEGGEERAEPSQPRAEGEDREEKQGLGGEVHEVKQIEAEGEKPVDDGGDVSVASGERLSEPAPAEADKARAIGTEQEEDPLPFVDEVKPVEQQDVPPVEESLAAAAPVDAPSASSPPPVPVILFSAEPEAIDDAAAETASPQPPLAAESPSEAEPAGAPSPSTAQAQEVDTPARAPSTPVPVAVSPSSPPPPVIIAASPALPVSPYRILSLDGGGLVGLIPQLSLLKEQLSALPSSPSPASHFDLIVGTSTSALLAVLLGHLGLNIADALDVCIRIAQKALALEFATAESARRKPKRGLWSRLFGGAEETVAEVGPSVSARRALALDAAIKTLLPSADQPFSAASSRTACSVAVLAFAPRGGSSCEQWLSSADHASHGLTVGEVVKASLAASAFFPSSSSWTRSPTSLNPASSALYLTLSTSSLLATPAAPEQPISLVSLGTGYSSLSLDALNPKRIGKTRLAALRDVKQIAASNAMAAERLVGKVRADKRVEVVRLDVDCGRCGIEAREEWETRSAVDNVVRAAAGGKGTTREDPMTAFGPSRSTSTPLLSPASPTSPRGNGKSLKKRASRLSFFSTLSKSSGPERRASSFAPSTSADDEGGPLSPASPGSPASLGPHSLAPPSRGLRTSVSMDDLTRRDFASEGGRGLYQLKEETGSTGSLRSG
ncbi:hypothetical protein JCM10213_003526 [Rhodosporidiobolus nylandii]